MKAILILFILGALVAFCFGQQLVGPNACSGEVPPVETDAFNPVESWSDGVKNFTKWDHRFNFFTLNEPYKVYDILVLAEPYDPATELDQIWELAAVAGHPGYYRFPSWRRSEYVGISGGQTHSFGYITKASPLPLMLTFDIVKYTCTPDFIIDV